MLSITVRKELDRRILDFDVECRPLSWYGGDFTTKEITCIAAQFIGEDTTHCFAMHRWEDLPRMLESFLALYNEADMVTGHFIRGFDLPLISTNMTEYDLGPLPAKLSHDTKNDLIKRHGMSGSQENLGAMLGTSAPKVGMNQEMWRSANRLAPEGVALTIARCTGDVRQHIEMRAELLRRGMLGPPKIWSPSGKR